MSRLPSFQVEPGQIQGVARQGRWRFVLLIVVFNILLLVTLLLSMQHQELTERFQLLVETRTVYEELLITQEMVESVTVTIVVMPGFTPQPTPSEP